MRIAVVCRWFHCWLWGQAHLRADDPANPTPGRQYQAVLDDFGRPSVLPASKVETATTEEQRRELPPQFPGPEDYYGRLLTLAEAHPGDNAAVNALVWIVATSTNGYRRLQGARCQDQAGDGRSSPGQPS